MKNKALLIVSALFVCSLGAAQQMAPYKFEMCKTVLSRTLNIPRNLITPDFCNRAANPAALPAVPAISIEIPHEQREAERAKLKQANAETEDQLRESNALAGWTPIHIDEVAPRKFDQIAFVKTDRADDHYSFEGLIAQAWQQGKSYIVVRRQVHTAPGQRHLPRRTIRYHDAQRILNRTDAQQEGELSYYELAPNSNLFRFVCTHDELQAHRNRLVGLAYATPEAWQAAQLANHTFVLEQKISQEQLTTALTALADAVATPENFYHWLLRDRYAKEHGGQLGPRDAGFDVPTPLFAAIARGDNAQAIKAQARWHLGLDFGPQVDGLCTVAQDIVNNPAQQICGDNTRFLLRGAVHIDTKLNADFARAEQEGKPVMEALAVLRQGLYKNFPGLNDVMSDGLFNHCVNTVYELYQQNPGADRAIREALIPALGSIIMGARDRRAIIAALYGGVTVAVDRGNVKPQVQQPQPQPQPQAAGQPQNPQQPQPQAQNGQQPAPAPRQRFFARLWTSWQGLTLRQKCQYSLGVATALGLVAWRIRARNRLRQVRA